jgi:outer membrane protein assembly factor BamB
MKGFLSFLLFILLSACIGPVKELQSQIEDVYFASDVDDNPTPLPDNFKNTVNLKSLWSKDLTVLPKASELLFNENSAWYISQEGVLIQLDLESGSKIKETTFDVGVILGLFSEPFFEYLYFIDEKNYLNKVEKNGHQLWRIKLPKVAKLAPVFKGNQIIFKYLNNDIESFDLETGLSNWTYIRNNPPLSITAQSGITISDNILYSGFPGGKVVIIDAENGSFLTEISLSRSKGVTDIERANDVVGDIIVVDRSLFAASYNGEIASFDRSSGSKIWGRKVSSYHGIISDNINLVFNHENDSIYNFDKDSGKTIWKSEDLKFRKISKSLIFENYILCIDYLGILHVLNLNEGNREGIYSFGESISSLIDFGGSALIEAGINKAKMYEHNGNAYIFLNNNQLIKIIVEDD